MNFRQRKEVTDKILGLFYEISKHPHMSCVTIEIHEDFVRMVSDGVIFTARDIPMELLMTHDANYFVDMAKDLAADQLRAGK